MADQGTLRESNVATGNPLEMDVLMIKSSINGGLSIAMFDYRPDGKTYSRPLYFVAIFLEGNDDKNT